VDFDHKYIRGFVWTMLGFGLIMNAYLEKISKSNLEVVFKIMNGRLHNTIYLFILSQLHTNIYYNLNKTVDEDI
jgi:hypothetical protein